MPITVTLNNEKKCENVNVKKLQYYSDPLKFNALHQTPLPLPSESKEDTARVTCKNGLISTIRAAYDCHHHLVLRPDDVWIAIMTQFSAWFQRHAEVLRNKFVSHSGQEKISLRVGGSFANADFGYLSQVFSNEISKRIKTPEMREWVLPNFSTTTDNDRAVGSVVLMASMKQYFSYECCFECGIPQVTLEGTVADWELVLNKAQQMEKYATAEPPEDEALRKQLGTDISDWLALLLPVLEQFVATAKGAPSLKWWSKICSVDSWGSGNSYLTGWATVFCCFNEHGYFKALNKQYPSISVDSIPSGYVSVDVHINDNGSEFDCEMIAGSTCVLACGNKVCPRLEWMVREKLDITDDPNNSSNPNDYSDDDFNDSNDDKTVSTNDIHVDVDDDGDTKRCNLL